MAIHRTMNCDKIKEELRTNGFASFSCSSLSYDDLFAITDRRYTQVKRDFLIPRTSNDENKGAWSNIYSDGEFPFHTDFAYQDLPPRYVALHCIQVSNSNRPTFIADSWLIPSKIKNRLSKVLWKVSHPEKYGTLRLFNKFSEGEGYQLKYDPVCMKPYFKKDDWIKTAINDTCKQYSIEHHWKKNVVLIWDNWRCFHSRGLNLLEESHEECRIIERYSYYCN